MKLEKQILVGFVAGVALGSLSRLTSMDWLQHALVSLEPVGIAFIRLITMVLVPLVIASVFVGVASLGTVRVLGRVGGKTLLYFLGTTFAAAVIGVAIALASRVGAGLTEAEHAALLEGLIHAPGVPTAAPTLSETLMNMIPQNPFASAALGGADLLPLIVAVCIFAAAATVVDTDGRRAVVRFFEGVNELSMVVIGWIMRLAPLAVFVLIAATIARSGLFILGHLATYAFVVIGALAAHVLLTLLPALVLGARRGIRPFFAAVSDALLLAFSTASSNATLPVSMAAARERLELSNELVGFVLPAGASLNKNGSAAYKAVTAVFIGHLFGLSFTGGTILTIVLMSTIAAFAGAGVPGSSLVTTLIVLNAMGLGPGATAGIVLVAAIDRPLDMCRTLVNTIGNLVGAAWIDRTESPARASS